MGKTRLALESSHPDRRQLPEWVCFCDLATVSRPPAVARAFATATGLSERAFRRLDDQLVEQLAGQHVLLVLDNCEHVTHAVAVLAERLLRETRNVNLLATSRERLEVDGEHVWQVGPLAADRPDAPAVRLFLDRARAADPAAAQQAADVPAVAALCASLDGLPLAIELAAARLPGTTVSELSGNLEDRFALLTTGRRADSRHHSLRAVVDWSYEQLTPAQQGLFGQLLETLRGYGLERLTEHGALDAAQGRHARWAAELVALAARGLRSADEASWAGTLERHFSDLRAAHSWLTGQDTELSLCMVAQLHWYALWRCQSEAFRWADVSVAAAAAETGSRSPFLPDALASAAFGAVYRGDVQAADASAHAALDAAQDVAAISSRRPLETLGEVAIFRGELGQASEHYLKAYDLSIGNGDFLDAAWDAASAAAAFAYGNRLEEASRLADQARTAANECCSPSALAFVSWVTGEIAASASPGQARGYLQRAIVLAKPAGSRFVEGISRVSLATLHARRGDPATAPRHYERVIGEWPLDVHRVPLVHQQRRTARRHPGRRPGARSHPTGRREGMTAPAAADRPHTPVQRGG